MMVISRSGNPVVSVINVARRDRNPIATFRRVRSTIEILGAKQPREVLRWISTSVGVGSIVSNVGWWDVLHVVERARVALYLYDGGCGESDPRLLARALDEITATCNYHLNLQ